MASDAASLRQPSRREQLMLAAICVAILLPFINKPFHIDDPMFLWAGQHILQHPLDPYGFVVNWHGTPRPMPDQMQNPPLISYYLAAVIAMTGPREIPLHIAMILPAIALVLGTWRLARDMEAPSVPAALATFVTPVVLVSATTIMSDIPMLAAYIWSIVYWRRGLLTGRMSDLLVGAFLIAVSTLTKYFGVTLFPLLIAYALMIDRRRPLRWLLPLLLPAVILVGYYLATRQLYGRGLLGDAANLALRAQETSRGGALAKVLMGFSFTGGCAAPLLLWWLWLRTRRVLLIVLIAAIATGISLAASSSTDAAIRPGIAATPAYALQFVLFVGGGAALLYVSLRHCLSQRRPDTLLLTLWIIGTFCFAAFLNWNIAARSVLPMTPALAIIAVSAWRDRAAPATSASRDLLWPALIAGAAASLYLAAADLSHARSQRDAALAIMNHPAVRQAPTVHFSGHWGFQEYMQRLGGVPIDGGNMHIAAGDAIVFPGNNSAPMKLPPGSRVAPLPPLEIPLLPGVSTMQWHVSGFYTNVWGAVPFAVGDTVVERYNVAIAEQPIDFVNRPATAASETPAPAPR